MTFDVQIKTNNNDNEYETLVVNYLRFISFILWRLLLYFFPLFHIPKFRVISFIYKHVSIAKPINHDSEIFLSYAYVTYHALTM